MPGHELYTSSDVSLTLLDGVLVLAVSGQAGRPFVLNWESLDQLNEAMDVAEKNQDSCLGLLFCSRDKDSFCAGADIDLLSQAHSDEELSRFILRGQETTSRLAALACPTIALIHGPCVGGGLELALSCDVRLVSDSSHTRLGLPEVRLGILPAWGGTMRLLSLVGLKEAMPLLLQGRLVPARQAARIGLAAECCAPTLLETQGRRWLDKLKAAREHGHHGPPVMRRIGLSDYLMDEIPPIRRIALSVARRRVLGETRGHYPAPLELLDIMARSPGLDAEERLDLEYDAALRLARGATSRHLISLFRRNRDKERGSPYSDHHRNVASIKVVGVVGAGTMGTGIARALLRQGRDVILVDRDGDALVRARRQIVDGIDRRRKRKSTADTLRRTLDRLILSDDLRDLTGAELLIESVPEIMDLKRKVLAEMAAVAQKGALLCTNTSSLSIADLAEGLSHGRRLYGLHFFNPAHKMPLVEIVRGPGASDRGLARLIRFCRDLRKTPLVVADSPAFVVNRLLAPYLLAAQGLLLEGASIAEVDRAARNFGLPMGPFELMDSVGLDIVLEVGRYLGTFPKLGVQPSPLTEAMVKTGWLGRKSGIGFYRWKRRRRKVRPEGEFLKLLGHHQVFRDWRQEDIQNRLTSALAIAGRSIIDEGVVLSEDDLDLASVFGMGFPPFRGGLATWMRETLDEAS